MRVTQASAQFCHMRWMVWSGFGCMLAKLKKNEHKYATMIKELLNLVVFTKYLIHELLGEEFILQTDHSSLRWLHNFQGLDRQLARWVEQLAS